jgi:hypothetical protein
MFSLVKDSTNEQVLAFQAPRDQEFEAALSRLGCRVEPKISDLETREYFLVDNKTGVEIQAFTEYMYDRACQFAVSFLGFSIY